MTIRAAPQKGGTDRAEVRPGTRTGLRPDQRSKDVVVGRVIGGRYRVVGRLGAGSLGTTYLCDDLRTTARVALKVFRREFARDEEFMARLRRQVKLAAALSEAHPGILAVSACDRTDDGMAFVATEYVDGAALKDVIRRAGPLDVRRALRLACRIAEALDAIHTRGFVHTEVRSQNVILTQSAGEETVKLKGLEVAGLRDTSLAGHLVCAGLLVSNPEYVAPEQIEGDQVTARTDIYGFGVVLYEMLTGRVPFSASTPDGVLAKHVQETAVPLNAVRPGIPSVLELRVKQALEKEPERRQRYIGDVANEYLCELAVEELAAETARQKGGVIRKIATTVHTRLPRQREISTEGAPLGLAWKVAAIVALLAGLSLPAIWLFSALQKPPSRPASTAGQPLGAPRGVESEQAAQPTGPVRASSAPPIPAQQAPRTPEVEKAAAQPPEAASAPGGTDVSQGPEERIEPPASPPPRESSLRPPGPPARLQTSPKRPDRVETPSTEGRRPTPTPRAQPPQPSRQETPLPARETPDPNAIIDWLLGRPTGRD